MEIFKIVIIVGVNFLMATPSLAGDTDFKKITKYEEIDKSLFDGHTVLLLDIDNTILRVDGHYGSIEYFMHTEKELTKKDNLTYAQSLLKNYYKWLQSQKQVQTRLIDDDINSFLTHVKSKGSAVLALTARRPDSIEITSKQLTRHDIKLDKIPGLTFQTSYKRQIFPDAEWCSNNKCDNNTKTEYHVADAEFYNGMLSCHELNPKGDVIKDFYKELTLHLKTLKRASPQRLVFVDDKEYNLTSIQKAAEDLGLEFHGYHIVDDFKYDHSIALLEEKSHSKN